MSQGYAGGSVPGHWGSPVQGKGKGRLLTHPFVLVLVLLWKLVSGLRLKFPYLSPSCLIARRRNISSTSQNELQLKMGASKQA